VLSENGGDAKARVREVTEGLVEIAIFVPVKQELNASELAGSEWKWF
jgi:hypothetical protein